MSGSAAETRVAAEASAVSTGFRVRRWLPFAAIWLLTLGITVALQFRNQAYSAELAGDPDEAAHYVTGLMIHDFVASGQWLKPVDFAEHYYVHYPKVTFGMWPPAFHILEALWFFVFTPAKWSALLLLAALAATSATLVFGSTRERFGWLPAAMLAVIFVLLPPTQTAASMVMADMQVGLFSLCAVVLLARYLRSMERRALIWFSVFTTLCLLTKANGIALVPLAPVACILARRQGLIWRRPMLIAMAVTLVIGLPWQIVSFILISRSGGEATTGLASTVESAVIYGQQLAEGLGSALFVLLAVAIGWGLVRLWKREHDPLLAAGIALFGCVLGYHSALGSPNPRYWVGAMPVIVILCGYAISWIAAAIPAPAPQLARMATLIVLASVVSASASWHVDPKPRHFMHQPAAEVLAQPNATALVVSSPLREGAFISELAQEPHRPGHTALRSGQVIASSTWYLKNYRMYFRDSAEARQFLDAHPIEWVVLDLSGLEDPYEGVVQQVRGALEQPADGWKVVATYPNQLPAAQRHLRLYRRTTPLPTGNPIHINLPYTLKADLVDLHCSR